jgi:hypothetical protein
MFLFSMSALCLLNLFPSEFLQAQLLSAYSGDVNRGFQRDVNSRSDDVNKVGAKLRWGCNHA